ncbi:MAG TPA: Spy/CpxP family protein refolding chaperone [Candidatus Acidoferrales bacterium]|nr:Spy/CpxP family protein refolding chaperone [Candidatus Acidoferrales bacterium]
MKKTLTIFAAVGTLAVVIIGAHAVHAAGPLEGMHSRFLVKHIEDDLNLTGDQKAQIKTILVNERPAIQQLRQQIEQDNGQLHSKTTYDEAFVRSMAQQESATVADAIVEREKIRSEIFAVLTPDQQQKLEQLGSEVRAAVDDRIAHLGDGL